MALIAQLLKFSLLCITAMINHVFKSFSAAQIYDLSNNHLQSKLFFLKSIDLQFCVFD